MHFTNVENLAVKIYNAYSPLFYVLPVAVDEELTCNKSPETCRYPKRNITRKNYQESSDEEDNPADFCFCE